MSRMYVNPILKIPIWFLIINNIIPIIGLLLWGWTIFDVAFVLVAEIVIFSLISIIKIISIKNETILPYIQVSMRKYSTIFGPAKIERIEKKLTNPFHIKMNAVVIILIGLFVGIGILSLALFDILKVDFNPNLIFVGLIPLSSHSVSFFRNYILGKEYLKKQPMDIVNSVMFRIGVIVFVLGLGLGMGKYGLLILVLLFRTIVDYNFHIKEHQIIYNPV